MDMPRIVISAGHYGSVTHVLETARILSPLDHIAIIAPARAAARVRVQLAWFEGVEVLTRVRDQPKEDFLLPLTRAFARAPLAHVVFVPSEFCIVDPFVLAESIRRALCGPRSISVIGIAPFDWPAATSPVVAVGPITAFWDLLRARRPRSAALLERYLESMDTEDEGSALVGAYGQMEPLDFMGDLLAHARGVSITALPPSALRENAGSLLREPRGIAASRAA